MALIHLLTTSAFGYWFFKVMTHPNSRANKKLPTFKFKFFQILPNVEIHIKGRIVHVHHWIALSIVFVISIVVDQALLDSMYTRGFLIGGIYQGFTFPDWKNILLKKPVS